MNAPDLSTYHAVHTALRGGAHRLAAGAALIDPADSRRVKAFRAFWTGYTGELVAHHTVEDAFFFPALADRVPATRGEIAHLSAEHGELDNVMAAAHLAIDRLARGSGRSGAAAGVLGDLAMHLDVHLDTEDRDILPLFAQHFTTDAYAELEACAIKSLGVGKQAAFSVPFIVGAVPNEERGRLLATAPLPMRLLYVLTRGRHERLVATAFGSAPRPEVQLAS